MNKIISTIVLVITDLIAIFISILLAVSLRKVFNLFWDVPIINYSYVTFTAVYVTLILMLAYFGIYSKRFDFWHESKLIVRSCFLSFVMLFAGLALGQNAEYYSRSTLVLIFLVSAITIPVFKLFIKSFLFKLGFWKKPAKVISENDKFESELFNNCYLGYVR
ncbi:TPA: UDP-phosphate galactose phosphotransferase, partial [Mannheimia haemolytica]